MQFLEATCISLSVETIRQRLLSRGLYNKRPLRVPELTRQQKINKLNWCTEHQNWNIENWRNVLSSHETRIGVRSDDHQIRVLRGRGRQARLLAARQIPKYQGGSVMFWRGIMLGGKTDLISFPASETVRNYVELVLEPVVRL
ncbi:hypothetical protein HHI36_014091 [Cryptolaemus montrouzieri]|uniref:Transposase Tc1-like domain-containing protein n=1 Tax=Cryptolaemus montrouzieri TaxID=559131 RepID=A0ABD2N1V4_9CUCU